jgi:hypothetical protein
MKHNEFFFWLDGYFNDKTELKPEQVNLIKNKLESCFTKATPLLSYSGTPFPSPLKPFNELVNLPQLLNPNINYTNISC